MLKLYFKFIVLIFLLVSCSRPARRSIANEDSLKIVSRYLQQAQTLSPARTAELKTLRDNLLRYLIHASYKSEKEKIEILESANRYFQATLAQITSNISSEVSNSPADQFFKIEKPPAWTLSEEIRYLNKITDDSIEVVDLDSMIGMARTLQKEFPQFQEMMINSHLDMPYIEGTDKELINELVIQMVTEESNEKQKLKLVELAENHLSPQVQRIRNVGQELASDIFMKFNDPDLDYVLKSFIGEYYKQIDIDVIKSIMSSMIEMNPNAPPLDLAKVLFQHAGPGLGKTLQQLGKEPGVGNEIQKILSTLESDGLEVPPHLVRELIAKDKAYEFISVDDKPLGTGTIAQVHRAIIKIDGEEKEVVVRFLKPGVEEDAANDIKFIRNFIGKIKKDPKIQMAKMPDIDKLMESSANFLNLDLDIPGTIERQIQAQSVYQRAIKVNLTDNTDALVEFKVPAVFPPKKGKISKLHIQEYIPHGQKFSNLKDPLNKEAVSRAMMDLWFSEAIFKSGYIHADLHQGNFTVLVSENSKKIEVAIFDYGMSAELSKEVREAFMMIAAGAQFQDSSLLARGLLSVEKSSFNSAAKKELSKLIAAEMKHQQWQPEQWIIWAVKNGYLHSEQLGSLARGGSLILQLPTALGQWELAKNDLAKITKREFMAWLTGKRKDFPLKINNLARISWSATRKSCGDLIKSLFKH